MVFFCSFWAVVDHHVGEMLICFVFSNHLKQIQHDWGIFITTAKRYVYRPTDRPSRLGGYKISMVWVRVDSLQILPKWPQCWIFCMFPIGSIRLFFYPKQ